ncbi:virulence factor, partial [Burkholderia sp. Bp8977]
MKALIATWPRRVAIAVSAWLITVVLMAMLMAYVEQPDPAHLEIGDWMKRFIVVPGLAALMVFLLTTSVMRPAQAAPAKEAAGNMTLAAEKPVKPFVAQVVGLIWLNPLQR